MLLIAIIYSILINLFGILIMRIDKDRALKGNWRISERLLLFIAFIGGAVGVFIGMKRYRHKTNKFLFKFSVPIIILLHVLLVSFFINS